MGERNTIIIVVLVIFVVLASAFWGVGFYYMMENEDLEASIGKLAGTPERPGAIGRLKQRILDLQTEKEAVEKRIAELNTDAETIKTKDFPVAQGVIDTAKADAITDHTEREKANQARGAQAKADANKISLAYETYWQKVKKADEALAAEQAKLVEAQVNLLKAKEQDVSKLKDAQKKNDALKIELDTLRAKMVRMRERRAHLFDLKEDGEIIAAEPETNLAVVSLGARNGVKPGMVFDVFEIKKDGKKIRKAKIRLQRVESQQSTAVILAASRAPKVCKKCGWSTTDPTMLYCVYCKFGDTGDPKEYKDVVRLQDSSRELEVVAPDLLNPVARGDHISSPFYLGGKNRRPFVFAVAGQPVGHSRQEIAKFLGENGCSLAEEITVDTDFVMLGVGPRAEPDIKNARELGASLIRERDLFDFFGRLGNGSDLPPNETAMR